MSLERLNILAQLQNRTLETLNLVERDVIHRSAGKFGVNGIEAQTVWQDEHSQMIVSRYEPRSEYPMHEHEDSIQYLICSNGEFEIHIPSMEKETVVRLRPTDCLKIPQRTAHGVMCTSSGCGKLLAVCVPPEKGYT